MKIRLIFSSITVCSVMLSSCVCGNRNTGKVASDIIETVTDSLVINDETGNYRFKVEYPKDTTLSINLAIGEFINESLNDKYMDDCSNIKQVVRNDFDATVSGFQSLYKSFEKDMSDIKLSYSVSLKVYAQTPSYITYLCEISQYAGGAHGSYSLTGVTLRKSDGRRIGWELFKNTDTPNFQNLIIKGLKKYWNITTDEELKQNLLFEENYDTINLPNCNPLFTEKGVEFVYNQYEIAAYALGTPTFTVPYSELEDNLMSTAKKLIN